MVPLAMTHSLERAQALRMRRFLMAVASYGFGTLLIGAGIGAGAFPRQLLLSFGVLALLINGGFYLLFRSGLNLKAADPSLTAPQMLAAIAAALHVSYYAGPLRGVLLTWLLVVFMFGLFRLSTAAMLKLAAAALAGYGAVIGLLYQQQVPGFHLGVDLFQWLLLAGVLGWFAVMGGYIGAMRARLRESESGLRKLTEDMGKQTNRLQIAQTAARMVVLDWDIRADTLQFSETPVWLRGPLPADTGKYPLFKDQIHPDDRARFLAARQRALDTLVGERPEFRVIRTDGEVIWVQSHQSVFAGPDGRAARLVAAMLEITARKEAEQALQSAKDAAEHMNAAKDSFLATMSHEIRTPLNGLLGMLELLALTRLERDQTELLDIAGESGRAMRRIIDDILDHAKIEAGKLQIVPEPVALAHLLPGIASAYQAVAGAKGLHLLHIVDARLSPALLADPLRLTQVLGNFLSNAVKFTAEGEITLSAEFLERSADQESVRLSVRDTGIGMTPEAQARAFQPFEQAAVDTARLYGGTGLGLAISRQLVQMMGGSVAIDSVPGAGTTISVTLQLAISTAGAVVHGRRATDTVAPVAGLTRPAALLPDPGNASASASVSGPPPAQQATASGPLVLAVDDSATNRVLIARQLGMLGMRVHTAADGGEALAEWHRTEFALVIIDCNMPGMDGYALTRAIREAERQSGRQRVPVLAWTANALPDTAVQCRAAGMDDLLVKPTDIARLKAMTAQWLAVAELAQDTQNTPAVVAEAPAAKNTAALNLHVFEDLCDGDRDAMLDMVRPVHADMQEQLAALKAALDGSDLAFIKAASHKVKGAAGMIGASALAAVCLQIETAAAAGDAASLPSLRPDLANQAQRTLAALDAAVRDLLAPGATA